MDQGPIARSGAWLAVGREIAETLERVDAEAFHRFVDVFRDDGRRWFFSGQGRSGLVAQMAAMRFMHMGRPAHFVGEATAPSIRAGTVSASSRVPAAPRSPSISARIAKDGGRQNRSRSPGSRKARLRNSPIASFTPLSNRREQFGGSLFEQTSLILLDAIVLELMQAVPDPHGMMLRRHTNLQ